MSSELRRENGSSNSRGESAPSTNFVESLVGGFMTSDARLFQEWRDWASRRMSRTRSSTIKRARFREWLRFIRGTTFWQNGRKPWIVGALTSRKLSRHYVSKKTSSMRLTLRKKLTWRVTAAT